MYLAMCLHMHVRGEGGGGGGVMACERVETIIAGAGISGVCMAVKLLEAGRTSFLVLERSGLVGGTWSVNAYPGCRCDIPSHLYSFSFAPNPLWTHSYSERRQIHAYIHDTAARHGVLPHVRFHTEVVSAVWRDADSVWHVEAAPRAPDGSPLRLEARFLIRAIGGLNAPRFPDTDIARFKGTWLHSSQWPADRGLEIVRGRTVAVVGTGASSIQLVPQVAEVAKKVYVCQRTPPWILPQMNDMAIPPSIRRILARFPTLLYLLWWALFIFQEFVYGAVVWAGAAAPFFHAVATFIAKRHIHRSISDPALRSAVLPSYSIGCKRVLPSNTFYRCLTRSHVELVRGSVDQVLDRSIVLSRPAAGAHQKREIEADVIVYATGFDTWTPRFPIVGRDGHALPSSATAMLGITTHGFPNFFMLLGPNTWVGHTSQIVMIEAQVRYILSCMHLVAQPRARTIELRISAQKQFERFLAKRFRDSLWHKCGGVGSWYVNPSTQRLDAIWPASTVEYMYRTRSASPKDYHIED